jgi:hypothetical protein
MLEKPHYGWTSWELPYFRSRISYIDDFPFMVLEALIEYFKSGESQDVTFDAEGWEYTFTFTQNVKAEERVICESTTEFAQEFINDLENDLDVWAHFARSDDSAHDELVRLIGELKNYLPKRENAFLRFMENKFEEIQNPDIDEEIRNRYFREFEELNTTTSSIYDLGDLEVLIILKDGTNLTSWSDVQDKKDVLYVSEDLSGQRFLSSKYSSLESLKSIVVKGMTSNVSSLRFMFSGCFSLRYVFGMDAWDVSNLKDITAMFFDCISLEDISFLETFDVSNVVIMEGLFQGCISLRDTSPLRYWDVGNVKDMHAMLCLCPYLDCLNGLESWDVGNVKTLESMFHGCWRLNDISCLSNWNLDSIENMFEMFRGCYSLENADALNGWDIQDDVITESMFRNSANVCKPKWYLDSTNDIEEHIKSIDDEEKLINIAYNHSNYIARKFAVEHISDENVLKDIIQNRDDAGVLEAAIKNENLKDYEFLLDQLENADSQKGFQILWRIDDEDYLTRIAKGNFSEKYRVLAINKLNDKSVLVDIGKNDENSIVRNFALNRLYTF